MYVVVVVAVVTKDHLALHIDGEASAIVMELMSRNEIGWLCLRNVQ